MLDRQRRCFLAIREQARSEIPTLRHLPQMSCFNAPIDVTDARNVRTRIARRCLVRAPCQRLVNSQKSS